MLPYRMSRIRDRESERTSEYGYRLCEADSVLSDIDRMFLGTPAESQHPPSKEQDAAGGMTLWESALRFDQVRRNTDAQRLPR